MGMPLQIYRDQRLLFTRSAHGEILALHGTGEAIVRLLLETPILHDLSPMIFPFEHGCYVWEGTLVEESEAHPIAQGVTNRFWPGVIQRVSPADLAEIFVNFGDQSIGEAILMATYRASFDIFGISADTQRNQ